MRAPAREPQFVIYTSGSSEALGQEASALTTLEPMTRAQSFTFEAAINHGGRRPEIYAASTADGEPSLLASRTLDEYFITVAALTVHFLQFTCPLRHRVEAVWLN